MVENIKIFH